MLIRTTWKKGANLRMQVNGFNGGESFPKVSIWDWSSLKSSVRANEWVCS